MKQAIIIEQRLDDPAAEIEAFRLREARRWLWTEFAAATLFMMISGCAIAYVGEGPLGAILAAPWGLCSIWSFLAGRELQATSRRLRVVEESLR